VISIHSQDYADQSTYLHPYAAKVRAIYPPVEIPRPDLQAVGQWRQALGLDGYKLVGFAGRFVEEKGFDYLLKAIPLIMARMPNVRFVYAGAHAVYEGFFQRWKHLLEANRPYVTMLGLITDHQKLANYYAMCDVFALPSRTDCFPSVQIEALLCGTPVVATNIPGAREVVQVTQMGLLVEPHSEQALADGLLRVLQDRANYVKPYEQMRAIFSTDRSVSEYEALLQSLVHTP
jgi:glycosyltransferase involved in cell wall biosynthesis